ncbi:MAG: PadR family transcriptional regulator [Clostridia bacterium]|nr:PadR family transcriptional regulator [Clostridia bacterium]
MLKHGILGLLNYGDMTGYEIMTAFRHSLSHFWTAQTSQIYRELQALEKAGWVTSKLVAQKSRPDKKVLSITESGRSELKRWLQAEQPTNVRMPFLMKTFFRGECSAEENIAFFRALAEDPAAFPNGSEGAYAAAEHYGALVGDADKTMFWRFTIEFGRMYEEMVKRWSKQCIRELERRQTDRSATI